MAGREFYTEQAINAQMAAEHEPLAQRQLQYLQSAERWEPMASHAQDLDIRARTYEEDRRLRPYRGTIVKEAARRPSACP